MPTVKTLLPLCLLAGLAACEEVSVTADAEAPETIITSQHGATSIFAELVVSFASSEPGTFQCSLDGGEFAACTSPHTLTALADGAHVFLVRAIDDAGNEDASPAELAWTVDTANAGLQFVAAPPAATNTRVAEIAFATNRAATFLCYLDETLVACAPNGDNMGGTFTSASLADGDHQFRVEATFTGSGEQVTGSTAWLLDATGPQVTFISPANNGATNAATVTVSYSVSEPATLACARNGTAVSCGTVPTLPGSVSTSLGALGETSNVAFRVTAVDTLGNTTQATLDFAVDRTAPIVSFGIETPTNIPFTANEAVTFRCTLVQLPDVLIVSNIVCNNPTEPSTSGTFSKTFGDGVAYRLDVDAADVAGNAAATISREFCGNGSPCQLRRR